MMSATNKALLEVVLGVAGDDEKMIPEGIRKVIRDDKTSHGEAGKARRGYLWRMLSKAAEEKIHRARQKVAA